MEKVELKTKNKIHPHKLTLWMAIGSIVMMFAGLTSAYIVKRNQGDWRSFEIPDAFWFSTIVILISSATMHFALKAFKAREMKRYRMWMMVSVVLGVLFLTIQTVGFLQLKKSGLGLDAHVAVSFLWVIVMLHAAHIVGGVLAMAFMSIRAYSRRRKNYSVVPVELISTYWHFVDVLWIYLLVFLLLIK